MKPPFRVATGDCIEGMATLEDASVDHVITDPPYSQHVHSIIPGAFSMSDDRTVSALQDRIEQLTEALIQIEVRCTDRPFGLAEACRSAVNIAARARLYPK